MSLIQANILITRYSIPDAPADIYVSYGVGKERVPSECLEIQRVAVDLIAEISILNQLRKELSSKMPDVVITVTDRLLIPVFNPS